MVGSSNVVDAKAAIHTLIKALPEAVAEKWDVDWGFSKSPERTWVYCGEVNWDSSEWVTNRTREETFRVEVIVNIKRRRGTPEELEREAVRITGLIEAAVKETPNLGLPAVVTCGFTPRKMDSFPSDEMGECQFESDVRITARL